MSEKIVLILVDGMRPDAMMNCGNPYSDKLLSMSTYCLSARTVSPSVTLPCHVSLFYGVDPQRHGILTNTFTPQVRPVEGLVERLDDNDKKCAFYYTWEELRDLVKPGHLCSSVCMNLYKNIDTDKKITDEAISYINEESPDFVFLYLGETDDKGHNYGWMSEEYMTAVNIAMSCVEKVQNSISDDYTIILLADHGGHKRFHGSEDDEDMLIPIVMCGKCFEKGKELSEASILDVPVTVTKLMGVQSVSQWEGKSLI
ncbi:MAG: alkaline phosphatase family protein [Clostridia bacterium]|nr:alkaline phosphatase family protein [Clostridia bacterium]